jgi:RimJ/RimL family protein N-acetyltransferase
VSAVTAWTAPTLEEAHVRLEPLCVDHADALWLASRDERTWAWMPVTRPGTREELDRWLDLALAGARAGTELPLATVVREPLPGSALPQVAGGGVLVGSTRFLALRPEHRSVEIGWTWLHPDAWGTGVNVEAKLLMLQHAFEVWGCRRVELKTDALNERSRGAMEALGASFEGIHRKHLLVRGGENRDTAWYALFDEDWPATQEALRRRLERFA